MTATDVLAIYGAILATAVAAWDIAKFVFERPRLRVSCYVGATAVPGVGVTERGLLVYSIANTGGKPIVVNTVGGALRSGSYFMLVSQTVTLPMTLQPGESKVIPSPMPEDIGEVTKFIVHDGLGKEWKASVKPVHRYLASRMPRTT
jgi:hypothetical protein